MKVLKVITIAAALSAVTGAAMADSSVVHEKWAFDGKQLIPSGVRIEGGLTGYGGAVLWQPSPLVGLALGYNGGEVSWRDSLKVDGTKYDIKMDNSTTYLNAEIHPWGNSENRWAKAVYVPVGVAYLDNDYDLKQNVSGGTRLKIDNGFYASADGKNASVNGKLKYANTFAPYVGLGFAPKFNKNWGAFAEIGAYYTDNPVVELSASDNLVPVDGTTTSTGEALNKSAYKIENKTQYEWMPSAKLGVSYNF
ncbi:ornithine uptake porin CarO [Acinetobacter gerneri]|uniref:ornithine uptake porin CarO n=1 Tax=Acinetobacter gerneri TaxID=202952 RepID=UPI0029364C68|nr:ornithine uptake porin CarO [Acinetobacter gerneri]MDV2440436.1 ornithine uptake porin CarO [Acinetobacter gerneri]